MTIAIGVTPVGIRKMVVGIINGTQKSMLKDESIVSGIKSCIKGWNKMDAKDAIEQLELMATNMIGELAKYEGKYVDVIAKQIDAIDMGIAALQKEV